MSLGGLAILAGLGRVSPALAQPTQTPEQVYRRLMSTPFAAERATGRVQGQCPEQRVVRPPEDQPAIPGLVGAAVLELRGPDLTNTIWYYVYASEAEALDHFDNGTFGRATTSTVEPGTDLEGSSGSSGSGSTAIPGAPSATLTEAYEPPDVEGPAWCVAARAVNWSWTSCSALAGFVEVIGYSAIQAGRGAQRGDDANAIALAQAALAHLDRLA